MQGARPGYRPKEAKEPLTKVMNTMWETTKDMSSKYKETSEGGLSVSVFLSDCKIGFGLKAT